jgi:hypothetical protein
VLHAEVKEVWQMRNPVAASIITLSANLLAVLALSSVAMAQEGRVNTPPPGYVMAGVPKMPNPPGPAPKHDLTGAWVGPQKTVMGPFPDMTPAGQAAFKLNHPVPSAGRGAAAPDALAHLAATNDPFMVCDPLGFPRDLLNHAVSMRGGIWFEPVSNRMLMLFEQQRIWREVWTDGRELPKKVDVKGAPDSRYYGYSVGHWDGDNTFVIDSTGLDNRTWLDEIGHPHTVDVHLEERYTRLDQYNLQVTVTVDDPKFYTKPFQLMQLNYYWMKDQNFEETLCIPSEAIQYRDSLAKPSGWGPGEEPK